MLEKVRATDVSWCLYRFTLIQTQTPKRGVLRTLRPGLIPPHTKCLCVSTFLIIVLQLRNLASPICTFTQYAIDSSGNRLLSQGSKTHLNLNSSTKAALLMQNARELRVVGPASDRPLLAFVMLKLPWAFYLHGRVESARLEYSC
jgi:hypothetical protein